jgi:anti-anti-sigma factor
LVLDDAGLLRGVADLRWRLDELLPLGAQTLLVDIHALTRLSSQTLAALLWAQRRCRLRGGQVRLLGANRRCRELLARTGLDEVFQVLPLEERAG